MTRRRSCRARCLARPRPPTSRGSGAIAVLIRPSRVMASLRPLRYSARDAARFEGGQFALRQNDRACALAGSLGVLDGLVLRVSGMASHAFGFAGPQSVPQEPAVGIGVVALRVRSPMVRGEPRARRARGCVGCIDLGALLLHASYCARKTPISQGFCARKTRLERGGAGAGERSCTAVRQPVHRRAVCAGRRVTVGAEVDFVTTLSTGRIRSR